MVVARTSLALTSAVSRASSSRRMARSCASRRASLHRREELALRFLGGEPGDRLELALLLLERRGEAAFLLAEHLLARDEVAVLGGGLGQPPLELVELPGEILLLGEDALLDLLDLALTPARLVLEDSPGLEGGLLGLELGGLATGFGVPRGVLDESLGAALGIADLALGEPLVEDKPDDEADYPEDRVETQPNFLHFRSIGGRQGISQIPASAVCRRCFEPGLTRWAPLIKRASGFPF